MFVDKDDGLGMRPGEQSEKGHAMDAKTAAVQLRWSIFKAVTGPVEALPDGSAQFPGDEIENLCRSYLGAMQRAEREACAAVAEADTSFDTLQYFGLQSHSAQLRANIAAAIRARSTSTT